MWYVWYVRTNAEPHTHMLRTNAEPHTHTLRTNAEPQRSGSDSKTYQPSAYVRGTVVTFKAEAADITAKGANHGVLAH